MPTVSFVSVMKTCRENKAAETKPKRREKKTKYTKGCVYGRLTLVGDRPVRRGKATLAECECSCGNVVFVHYYSMLKGSVRSCGCLRAELTRRKSQESGLDMSDTVEIDGYVLPRESIPLFRALQYRKRFAVNKANDETVDDAALCRDYL